MPFDIENFSSYLCFVLPNKITLPPELDSRSLQLGVNVDYLPIIIDQLNKMYEEAIKSVIELTMGSTMLNYEILMKAIISRCVEISRIVTYGHFLLVCTLIKGIVTDSFTYVSCFLIPNLCYYCLIAVYNRCYKEFFDSKEGTDETLGLCIVSLKQFFETRKNLEQMRNVPVFGENGVTIMMKNLIKVEHTEFLLLECEQAMLNDMLSRMPIVHPSATLPKYKSSESESETSSSRGLNPEDATECLSMDEDCSNSTSKPFESELLCIGTSLDATESVSMGEDCSYSTSRPSESELLCIGTSVDATESVSMDDDYSNLTNKSSESESSSSCRDIISENSEQDVSMRSDCSYYKKRICDICGSRCATFAVSCIEKIYRTLESNM